MKRHVWRLGFVVMLIMAITGCQPPSKGVVGGDLHTDSPKDAVEPVPWEEPLSAGGNPMSYTVLGKKYHVLRQAKGYRETGLASWYGPGFHGKLTSNGEVYDMHAISAAHKSLPLPSFARVKNLRNGKEIIVRINDRGPFVENRVIDLSYAAATRLDMIQQGTALVEIEVITSATKLDSSASFNQPLASQDSTPLCSVKVAVQVGAFAQTDNARRLLDKLLAAGFLEAVLITLDDGTLAPIKIRIPGPEDVAALDALLVRLSKNGFASVHVIVDRAPCGS